MEPHHPTGWDSPTDWTATGKGEASSGKSKRYTEKLPGQELKKGAGEGMLQGKDGNLESQKGNSGFQKIKDTVFLPAIQ